MGYFFEITVSNVSQYTEKKITKQQDVENRQAAFNYITLFINIVVQGRSLVKAFISFVYLLSVMIEDSGRNSVIVHISVALSKH